ncbi:MAG: acylphosphatase [Sphaerobacteraceae bacterium]|nr:MAG: acylphosphatase [Sphaerobacteraceae bacterium]
MGDSRNVVCARIVVEGRVQGVGFRQWVRKLARQRNLSGWVMNRQDGQTVEAEVQGASAPVHRMTELLAAGPPGARVDKIDVQWINPQNIPASFEIRR